MNNQGSISTNRILLRTYILTAADSLMNQPLHKLEAACRLVVHPRIILRISVPQVNMAPYGPVECLCSSFDVIQYGGVCSV